MQATPIQIIVTYAAAYLFVATSAVLMVDEEMADDFFGVRKPRWYVFWCWPHVVAVMLVWWTREDR